MVKPTPDPPFSKKPPPGHPLYASPLPQTEFDPKRVVEHFVHQSTLLEVARRNEALHTAKPPRWWQFWRWRKAW
ncbi:hypothetical protein RAM80_28945 [Pseudomonas sp. App30]|uniref:hypothetical protein n=1 Tax=Pseudomonas sp. App30 TaxID=3068990 RepID=UPI003A8103DF